MRAKKNIVFRFFVAGIVCSLLTATLLGAVPTKTPPVQVIVQGTSLDAATAAVRANHGYVTAEVGIINAVVASVTPESLARLAETPGVVRVTLDRQVEAAGQGSQVNVEFPKVVGTQEVWDAGDLGAGVTVAFLDSGVEPTFVELRYTPGNRGDRFLAYYDVPSGRLYKPPTLLRSPRDPNGHGTHVAGIVANSFREPWDDQFRGIAPAANIVAVRVLDETGVGTYANVIQGINWIVQHKDQYNIRVLNISMYAIPVAPYWADPYNLAVMAAWHAGIVVVASAGNTGPDPMSIGVPGNTPYVITVGAYTDARTSEDFSDDYIPEFSAAGPTLDAFVKPDVIAPGAHVVSLMRYNTYLSDQYPEKRINGRYFEMSGTSMSTAVVSGIAALMLSEHPELTPDQVKYRLMMTARPQFSEATGEVAYSIWQQGAGRVWASDAVFTDIEGEANHGMDLAADLAGVVHYQGWTTFDPETGEFKIIGGGLDSVTGGYTTWNGGFASWADGYGSWAGGETNWSSGFASWADGFASWADGFASWADGYNTWTDGFASWADGFASWADACNVEPGESGSWEDGFASWADGFASWADGFGSWADGSASWADFVVWTDGFASWADGFASWADDYDGSDTWSGSCQDWVNTFGNWTDGFASWADGFASWADGLASWSGAFGVWEGGYASWPSGFASWADGFASWADGFGSWADACGVEPEDYSDWADGFGSWADGFGSWADGFGSWADGFGSWADYIMWVDGFSSWADGFSSWADGFSSWADGYGDTGPGACVLWVNGFGSWADGFSSWADGFSSWADGAPSWTSSFGAWEGGYTSWAGGFSSWADGFSSWADNVGDPTWAASFYNLTNLPTDASAVSMNNWVDVNEQ